MVHWVDVGAAALAAPPPLHHQHYLSLSSSFSSSSSPSALPAQLLKKEVPSAEVEAGWSSQQEHSLVLVAGAWQQRLASPSRCSQEHLHEKQVEEVEVLSAAVHSADVGAAWPS